jgi:hypothetical protein
MTGDLRRKKDSKGARMMIPCPVAFDPRAVRPRLHNTMSELQTQKHKGAEAHR